MLRREGERKILSHFSRRAIQSLFYGKFLFNPVDILKRNPLTFIEIRCTFSPKLLSNFIESSLEGVRYGSSMVMNEINPSIASTLAAWIQFFIFEMDSDDLPLRQRSIVPFRCVQVCIWPNVMTQPVEAVDYLSRLRRYSQLNSMNTRPFFLCLWRTRWIRYATIERMKILESALRNNVSK